MIFKHALITCLLLLIHQPQNGLCAEPNPNPSCSAPKPGPDDQPAHFMFFVDKQLAPALLTRVQYFFKALSCEIPTAASIKSLVMSYTSDEHSFGKEHQSDQIVEDLYRDMKENKKDQSLPCERFKRALGRAPAPFLEHDNVQFMIPIVEGDEDYGCFVKAFQDQYRDHPKRNGFFFNGFLVNLNETPENDEKRQGVRIEISDFVKTIDPNRSSLLAARVPDVSSAGSRLYYAYKTLMHNILLGKNVRDWEEILTTTVSSTTTTLMITTENSTEPAEIFIPKSENSTSTEDPTGSPSTFEIENEADKFFGGLIEDYPDEKNSTDFELVDNTTTVLSKRAFPVAPTSEASEVNTTTVIQTSTVVSSTVDDTTINLDYDLADEQNERIGLSMASGKSDDGFYMKEENKTREVEEPKVLKHSQLSSDILIMILLLLLLIWLFCLFLCLIWMFRCAKRKKNKIEGEFEQQQQLLLPLLESRAADPPPEPIATKPSISAESDEWDDEDWKAIKPAKYTDSTVSQNPVKSETETVKQPSSTAQYAPVEVSEFEDKIDDDVDNRPRGYVAAKKTAPLRFD